MKLGLSRLVLSLVLILFFLFTGYSQETERPAASLVEPSSTYVWLGTYGKVRLTDNLYWDAQTHFRTTNFEGREFVGRLIQIYNRHGLNYYFSKDFQATIGGVLRLNFTPEPGNSDFETITLEPRLWHQYVIGQQFTGIKVFHRFRFEHRFSRSNAITSPEFLYRNRYRYRIESNIPLNTEKMRPGTFFFSPNVELIMQSGNPIIDSPMEDLRIQPVLGYLATPNIKYSMSMMYSTGQSISDGAIYNERWIFRFNVYWSLDFRKFDKKIPDTRFYD